MAKIRTKPSHIVTTMLLPLFLSCSSSAFDQKPIVVKINEYNKSLVEAYRSSDITPLKGLAMQSELNKITVLIDLNKQRGTYLDSKLLALSVKKLERPSEDKARVWTNEEWEYVYKDIKDNAANQEPTRENNDLVYFLVYRDELWWIEQVKWEKDYLKAPE